MKASSRTTKNSNSSRSTRNSSNTTKMENSNQIKPMSNPLVELVGTQVVVVGVGVSGLEGIEYGREENKQLGTIRLMHHQNDNQLLEI